MSTTFSDLLALVSDKLISTSINVETQYWDFKIQNDKILIDSDDDYDIHIRMNTISKMINMFKNINDLLTYKLLYDDKIYSHKKCCSNINDDDNNRYKMRITPFFLKDTFYTFHLTVYDYINYDNDSEKLIFDQTFNTDNYQELFNDLKNNHSEWFGGELS